MVLTKTTVKIGWSPARACVAPEAEYSRLETEPKCIPENAILSHLNKQPLFRLGGAQTCLIIVHPTLIDQISELHEQPTSPCTHSSLCSSLQSRKGAQTLNSGVRGICGSLRVV
eukprot:1539465-Pleurochrysis_carterae.AAC.1